MTEDKIEALVKMGFNVKYDNELNPIELRYEHTGIVAKLELISGKRNEYVLRADYGAAELVVSDKELNKICDNMPKIIKMWRWRKDTIYDWAKSQYKRSTFGTFGQVNKFTILPPNVDTAPSERVGTTFSLAAHRLAHVYVVFGIPMGCGKKAITTGWELDLDITPKGWGSARIKTGLGFFYEQAKPVFINWLKELPPIPDTMKIKGLEDAI